MMAHRRTLTMVATAAVMMFLISIVPSAAAAADPLVQDLQNDLDLSYFDRFWGELEKDARDFLPELNWRKLLEQLQPVKPSLIPERLLAALDGFSSVRCF